MAVGRLGGDSAAERFGLPVTAGGGLILAALGLTLAAAAAAPVPSLAGFAVMGIGLASVFPLALRAAESGVGPAGPALAAVSTVGYTGLFLGPPSIGLLAELVSLRGAFFLVIALCAGAAVLVGGSGRRSVSGAVRRHRAR